MPDPVSSYLAATETARLRAENRILAAELHKAKQRTRVMALIARAQNDALEVLVRHMAAHSTKPPAATAEGPTASSPATPGDPT